MAREIEDGPAGTLDSGRVFDEPMADPRAAFADAPAPQLPSACCEVCGGGSACPKRWALGSGTRIFSRSRPREIIFSSELSPSTGRAVPVMSNRNHGFDPSAGYYATIKRYLGRDEMNRDHFLEFTYWGLTNWQTSDQRAGERLSTSGVTFGSLFSPFAPTSAVFTSQVGGFNRADRHVIESATELHSFELEMHLVPRNRQDRLVLLPNGKWRRECNPGQYFSGSFGLRYMIIDDRFDFASEALIQTQQGSGMATGLYDVNTRNHLIGLQFGADVMWRQCRGEWGFRAKAGPYFNFASQDSRVTTDAAADPFAAFDLDSRTHGDEDIAALIGQVGLVGSYKLRPRLTVRGAWDLMWICGVALASEQVSFSTSRAPGINTNGHMFLQGLTLEAEVAW